MHILVGVVVWCWVEDGGGSVDSEEDVIQQAPARAVWSVEVRPASLGPL